MHFTSRKLFLLKTCSANYCFEIQENSIHFFKAYHVPSEASQFSVRKYLEILGVGHLRKVEGTSKEYNATQSTAIFQAQSRGWKL